MKLKNTIFLTRTDPETKRVSGFIPALVELRRQPLYIENAYNLHKLSKQLDERMKTFEAARQGLLNKYGEKDKDGKFVQENGNIKISNIQEFEKEFKILVEKEEDYDYEKQKLIFDPAKKNLFISAQDLALLEEIIEIK
ncbi:MAG: hypothetical protein ACFFD2_11060 [Promethearchaeota archaeon]